MPCYTRPMCDPLPIRRQEQFIEFDPEPPTAPPEKPRLQGKMGTYCPACRRAPCDRALRVDGHIGRD